MDYRISKVVKRCILQSITTEFLIGVCDCDCKKDLIKYLQLNQGLTLTLLCDTVEEFMGFGKEPFQEMKLAMKFWPIQSCLTSQKLVHGLVLVMQYEADKIIKGLKASVQDSKKMASVSRLHSWHHLNNTKDHSHSRMLADALQARCDELISDNTATLHYTMELPRPELADASVVTLVEVPVSRPHQMDMDRYLEFGDVSENLEDVFSLVDLGSDMHSSNKDQGKNVCATNDMRGHMATSADFFVQTPFSIKVEPFILERVPNPSPKLLELTQSEFQKPEGRCTMAASVKNGGPALLSSTRFLEVPTRNDIPFRSISPILLPQETEPVCLPLTTGHKSQATEKKQRVSTPEDKIKIIEKKKLKKASKRIKKPEELLELSLGDLKRIKISKKELMKVSKRIKKPEELIERRLGDPHWKTNLEVNIGIKNYTVVLSRDSHVEQKVKKQRRTHTNLWNLNPAEITQEYLRGLLRFQPSPPRVDAVLIDDDYEHDSALDLPALHLPRYDHPLCGHLYNGILDSPIPHENVCATNDMRGYMATSADFFVRTPFNIKVEPFILERVPNPSPELLELTQSEFQRPEGRCTMAASVKNEGPALLSSTRFLEVPTRNDITFRSISSILLPQETEPVCLPSTTGHKSQATKKKRRVSTPEEKIKIIEKKELMKVSKRIKKPEELIERSLRDLKRVKFTKKELMKVSKRIKKPEELIERRLGDLNWKTIIKVNIGVKNATVVFSRESHVEQNVNKQWLTDAGEWNLYAAHITQEYLGGLLGFQPPPPRVDVVLIDDDPLSNIISRHDEISNFNDLVHDSALDLPALHLPRYDHPLCGHLYNGILDSPIPHENVNQMKIPVGFCVTRTPYISISLRMLFLHKWIQLQGVDIEAGTFPLSLTPSVFRDVGDGADKELPISQEIKNVQQDHIEVYFSQFLSDINLNKNSTFDSVQLPVIRALATSIGHQYLWDVQDAIPEDIITNPRSFELFMKSVTLFRNDDEVSFSMIFNEKFEGLQTKMSFLPSFLLTTPKKSSPFRVLTSITDVIQQPLASVEGVTDGFEEGEINYNKQDVEWERRQTCQPHLVNASLLLENINGRLIEQNARRLRFSDLCEPGVGSKLKAAQIFRSLLDLSQQGLVELSQEEPVGDANHIFIYLL